MTSYQGQTRTVASATKYVPPSCVSYSVTLKKINKCLKKRTLSFTPGIKSRGQVRYVKAYVNGKFVKKVKKSPFKVKVKLSKKLKAGKSYKYKVKVYFKPTAKYPKGRVITKSARFKICK
jgi:beta-galactosidase/beta-glucuronidase